MDNTINFNTYCKCKICNAELTMNDIVFFDEKTKEDLGCVYCIGSSTAVNHFED